MQISPGLPIPTSTPEQPTPKTAEEAAKQFESLLIAQMLKSARDSGWKSGDSEESDSQNETMLDLADQQFAQMLAQKGGLNLSRMILDGLKQREAEQSSGAGLQPGRDL
ncbi:MAG: rod-binding protein [Bryobacteraceae bacterium]